MTDLTALRRLPIPAMLLLALCLGGCVGGPSYAGGPTSDQPHGVISPGMDITVWQVDGHATASRAFDLYVAPGQRLLKVRLEFPIESESSTPYAYQDLSLYVEQGVRYHLDRKHERYPPFSVQVREERLR